MPMNTWMNDANVLAQIGHTLGACLYLVLLGWFRHWRYIRRSFQKIGATTIRYPLPHFRFAWLALDAAPFVLYAGLKEFWYDANYELPRQTALDNWTDFSFYMLGLVLGAAIVFVRLRRRVK